MVSLFYSLSLFAIPCISFVICDTKLWNQLSAPVVLMRLKRHSPFKTFTYSGFNPNSGLTALASSAQFMPAYYGYPLTQPQYNHYPVQSRLEPEASPTSDYSPATDYRPESEYPSSSSSDDDRKLPSQNLIPPSEQAPTSSYNGPNTPQLAKKPQKKKPNNVEDEDDEDEKPSKSRSSSNASFNAWFPIVLGMYPNQGNPSSYKDEDTSASRQRSPEKGGGLGTTVIANSVSNGKSSVASSHAIAYGGEPPLGSYHKG